MLKRQYLADNKTCKVTFTTEPDVTKDAKKVVVVGNFNDWDATANPMKRRKDGSDARKKGKPLRHTRCAIATRT